MNRALLAGLDKLKELSDSNKLPEFLSRDLLLTATGVSQEPLDTGARVEDSKVQST